MSRYKVGDEVMIRGDLVPGTRYAMEGEFPASCSFVSGMNGFRGTVATISRLVGYGTTARYLIKGDPAGWHWTDDMFAGLAIDLQDDTVIDIDLDELF